METACYIVNRRYQRSINDIPYRLLCDRHPVLTQLRRIGSEGFSLKYEINREVHNKTSARGVRCRILGYNAHSLEYIVEVEDDKKIALVSSADFIENLSTSVKPIRTKRTSKPRVSQDCRRMQARRDFHQMSQDRSAVGTHNELTDTHGDISLKNLVPPRRRKCRVKKIDASLYQLCGMVIMKHPPGVEVLDVLFSLHGK